MTNIGRVGLLGILATIGCLAPACGPNRDTDAGGDAGGDARTDARSDANDASADVRDVTMNDATDTPVVTDVLPIDVFDVPTAMDVQDAPSPMDVMDVADVPTTVDTGAEVDGGAGPRFMVVRLGDGAGPLAATGAMVFLDEYNLSGTRTRTIALPTAASGGNLPFVISGTANSEGALSRSSDGHYVTLAGYAAVPATAGVASSSSASTPRVAARVDSAGNVDTSTSVNNAFDGNNVRAATTVDGTAFWIGGSGNTTTGGTSYVTLGGTMGTSIHTMPTSTRSLQVYEGQLYGSSGTGSFQTVFTIGTGTPTTSGQTATALPGLPTNMQAYGFAFVSSTLSGFTTNTLYVADDRATGGGIHKFTYNATTMNWTAAPDATGLSSGVRGLTALVGSAGTVTIIGTTAEASANTIVTCTDTALATAPVCTVIATAATNQIFRGVALSPM